MPEPFADPSARSADEVSDSLQPFAVLTVLGNAAIIRESKKKDIRRNLSPIDGVKEEGNLPPVNKNENSQLAQDVPIHPGVAIKERLDELRLTVSAAAKGLCLGRAHLFTIVNGKGGVTAEMAVRLEKGIGRSAETWLQLQSDHDLALARRLNIQVPNLVSRKGPKPI